MPRYKGIIHQIPGLRLVAGVISLGVLGVASNIQASGILSWTRISQGRYRVVFQDAYPALAGPPVMAFQNTAEQGYRFQIRSEDVAGATLDPSVDLLIYDYNSPGNLVDPANTDVYLEFLFQTVPNV